MVSYANGGAAQGPKGVESGAEKRRGHLNAISLSTRPQSKIESRLFPIQDRAPPRLLFSLSKPTCDVSHAILKQKEKPERRRKEVGTGKAPPFSSLFLMQAEGRASVINKAREKKKVRRPVFPVFLGFIFILSFSVPLHRQPPLTHCHRVTSVPRSVASSLSKNSLLGSRFPSISAAKRFVS